MRPSKTRHREELEAVFGLTVCLECLFDASHGVSIRVVTIDIMWLRWSIRDQNSQKLFVSASYTYFYLFLLLSALRTDAMGVGSAAFHAALAAFLWSQTNRVRLVMNDDHFELFNLSNDGTYLKEKPSNYVAGTVNRWKYKDVIDYGFFPSRAYPFIVYFKETDTPKDQWGGFGWWGMFASMFDPTRSKKEFEGQPHFMPALFDTEEFIKQMDKHGVKSRSRANNYEMWH